MKVTFDSQVWEPMVFPDRHLKNPDHVSMVKIKDALRSGRLQGFLCDTIGTVEAIAKSDRAAYRAGTIPIIQTSAKNLGKGIRGLSITIETDHSLHPGLHPRLSEKLEEALAIGIRLLSAPYMNQPLPSRFLNDLAIYAPEVLATGDYNERFGSAVSAIQARGVGGAVLPALVTRIAQRLNQPTGRTDVQLLEYAYNNARDEADKREIEKAFAESADGDAVAAHIAFGNDYFCTEDQGKSARGASIFDAANRAWLKATYAVKFVTMQELVELL
jgi:hypothetical protein